MIRTIWVMWKPGEERIYSMSNQPSEPWATAQKANGYNLASFDVSLPDTTVSIELPFCSSALTLHWPAT